MSREEFDDLVTIFLKLKTREEVADFLKVLLTDQELDEIPQRLVIVKMLNKSIPQHEIAKKLHVGVATVTRGSKEIQKERFKKIKDLL
jgi:TrpR family trp operon transcriptional repressor